MGKPLKLKSDKFRKKRGGRSFWLMLSCEKCNTKLFSYQKDGPGILKRLYLDRIVGQVKRNSNLICKKCRTVIGIPIIYKKEKRPAFRLFAGAIRKDIG